MRRFQLLLPAFLLMATGCDLPLFGPSEAISLHPADSTFLIAREPIDPGTYPFEEPPDEILVDSLFYRAEVIPEDTAMGSEPMSLRLEVTVRNPWDREMTLWLQGCGVRPLVYATPARAREPVWAPSLVCGQAPRPRTIEPASSRVFEFYAHDSMLAGGLADGRYYFTALFQRVESTIALSAGSADVRLREPGLEHSISLHSAGDVVRAEVEVTNRNDVSIPLQYGQCALSLGLYRDAARTDLVSEWHYTDTCLSYLGTTSLAPGESHSPWEFSREFAADRLEEVAPGRYFLTVDVRLNWRTYRFPLGRLEVH